MSETKIYCGNGRIVNTQYGDLMKLSFTEEDLKKMQAALVNGWVNVTVPKRREPSAGGMTHYCQIDTWQPDARQQEIREEATEARRTFDEDPNSGPLPF